MLLGFEEYRAQAQALAAATGMADYLDDSNAMLLRTGPLPPASPAERYSTYRPIDEEGNFIGTPIASSWRI